MGFSLEPPEGTSPADTLILAVYVLSMSFWAVASREKVCDRLLQQQEETTTGGEVNLGGILSLINACVP